MDKIRLTRPDDWHLHVRSGAMLQTVIAHTARQFGRAVIMPNLQPPITHVAQALAYREEILAALPADSDFQPLLTLYLTAQTTPDDIRAAAECPHVYAFKLYPAGATTHSDAGIHDVAAAFHLFAALEKYDVPLLIHGEVTDAEYDIFDREQAFIERSLHSVVANFPQLRVVLEHATTRDAVQFVESASARVAATITPQHLLYNRNALLAGGIKPHYYCLPVLKREIHRQALLDAATSGNRKFFLGTDSAPHLTHLKENACGCAGCYSAPLAMELYAEAFAQRQALDKLEGFASFFGADFYRLPRNSATLTLQRQTWTVPQQFTVGEHSLTPLRAGETLHWQVVAD
jgi:dihydroorotase